VLRRPVGRGVWCSDEQGEVVDALVRGEEVRCPWPVLGEFGEVLSACCHEPGGGVQQAVAEPFGFGFGEVAVEGEQFGPGEQVVGAHGDLQPGGVDRETVRGEFGESGGFVVADLAFGAAAAAVQRFDVGDVCAVVGVVGDVGDEHLQAPPGGVAESELRAGVGVLAPREHAGAVGPARQVGAVGDLGDVGVAARLCAVGGERLLPAFVGDFGDGLCDVDGERMADTEPHPEFAALLEELLGASRGVGSDGHLCVGGPPGSAPARRRGPRCGLRRCWTRRCRGAASRRGTRRSRRDTPSADGTPIRPCRSPRRPACQSASPPAWRRCRSHRTPDRRPRPTPRAGPQPGPL